MRAFFLILLLQLIVASAQAAPVLATASGSVHNPGRHPLPAGSRLSHLALAATPTSDAYMLGAALLRDQARTEQTRLKAGLLFDLDQLIMQNHSAPAMVASLQQLSRWISSLPVTGRVAPALDPRVLEATPSANMPVQAGDHLFYPTRPATITITGAVTQGCSPQHIALQAPASYLPSCATAAGASADYIHVIQPDGHAEKLGIALWNRAVPSHLAPGAIIFVPLADNVLRGTAPHFNEDAIRFLATQLLAAPGTSP